MANHQENVMKNIYTHLNKHGVVIFCEPNANFLNTIVNFGTNYPVILIIMMKEH